jgi:hypothetical protein
MDRPDLSHLGGNGTGNVSLPIGGKKQLCYGQDLLYVTQKATSFEAYIIFRRQVWVALTAYKRCTFLHIFDSPVFYEACRGGGGLCFCRWRWMWKTVCLLLRSQLINLFLHFLES